MSALDTLSHSWKLFKNSNGPMTVNINIDRNSVGSGQSIPRHKTPMYKLDVSSLSKTVFNRIATDVAMVPITHARIDKTNDTHETIDSGLNECLTMEANIDQSSFQLIHDLVYSMFDEGTVAVVPVETDHTPNDAGSYDILSMRVARIRQWYPKHVEVEIYNDVIGEYEYVLMSKRSVAIIENPFSEIVNSGNSTLNRLKRKMALLDKRDEEVASGRFNMIIRLPYDTKSSARKQQAKTRRQELQEQLTDADNTYGVGYISRSEDVIQLNRPIDSDLPEQVKYLREEFYNQLGMTENIFNGTADESEMNNYYARAIDPILKTIVLEFKRKFLTKTGRTQGQTVTYNRDIFKLVPVSTIAEIAEAFSRNEILSPNELRSIVGYKSSKDPKSDELANRNIAQVNQVDGGTAGEQPPEYDMNLIDEQTQ